MTHPENRVFLLAVLVYDLCSEGQKIPRASSSSSIRIFPIMTHFKQINLTFNLRFMHIQLIFSDGTPRTEKCSETRSALTQLLKTEDGMAIIAVELRTSPFAPLLIVEFFRLASSRLVLSRSFL